MTKPTHPTPSTHPTKHASFKRLLRACFRYGLLLGLALSVTGVAAAEGGWYVGVKAGQTEVDTQLGGNFPQFIDGDDTALAAGIGYRFGEYLAVEAWFQDFGQVDAFGPPCADTAEVCAALVIPTVAELEGFKVRALGYWPLAERVALYGIVGAIDWDIDIRADQVAGGVLIDSVSGTDFLYGAGAAFNLSRHIEAFVEYEILDFDVEVPGIGLKWRF